MHRIILFYVTVLFLFMPSMLFAACAGSVVESPIGTFAAYDTSQECVQEAVTAATASGAVNSGYGNIVTIPAGSSTWTETNGITITKDVKIQGAGVDSTILTSRFSTTPGMSTEVYFFLFTPDATAKSRIVDINGAGTIEVSGIYFKNSMWNLYIDAAPDGNWSVGDTITGQTSGKQYLIRKVLSTRQYYVEGDGTDYNLGEVLCNESLVCRDVADNYDRGSLMYPLSYDYGIMIGYPGGRYVSGAPIKRVKIHNNKFFNLSTACKTYGEVSGVFYLNNLINTRMVKTESNGKASWDNYPAVLGTGDGWYSEDNTFHIENTYANRGRQFSGSGHGGSHIERFNTVTGTFAGGAGFVESHSGGNGYIGTQITEVYGNRADSASMGSTFDMRGGKGMLFYNALSNSFSVPGTRKEAADAWFAGELPANMCPSSAPKDDICGEGEYCPQICLDLCVCAKPNHLYMWGTQRASTHAAQALTVGSDRYDNVTGHNSSPVELVENREFFTEHTTTTNGNADAVFDGTTGSVGSCGYNGGPSCTKNGVGCGTLANRPACTSGCTIGVGYWVPNSTTDPAAASCSNVTDYTGDIVTYPSRIDAITGGKLYRLTSPGTWTEYYTPYTYPHPLRVQKFTGNVMIGGAGLFN